MSQQNKSIMIYNASLYIIAVVIWKYQSSIIPPYMLIRSNGW